MVGQLVSDTGNLAPPELKLYAYITGLPRNWTVFLESARKVKESGIGYGLEFVGQYDEETKLMNMISRDWQVDFFKANESSWYDIFSVQNIRLVLA